MLRHPYHEDCVVLPTRPTLRPDNKNIERDIANRLLRDDTSQVLTLQMESSIVAESSLGKARLALSRLSMDARSI